jgi:nucleoid-associated protein YgaU
MIKKSVYLIVAVMFLLSLTAGCLSVRTVEKERVDLEVEGNEGYLLGGPKQQAYQPKEKTRKILQVDVDFSEFQSYGPPEETEEIKIEETEIIIPEREMSEIEEENKGYMQTKPKEVALKEEPESLFKEGYAVSEEEEITETPVSYITYVVKEDESLWKIAAKPEIYGDPTKWQLIYEANKDKIDDPNNIKAGLELKIPQY